MQTPRPTAIVHDLKIWPSYFEAVAGGRKTFELRSDPGDRFQEGDVLRLHEYVLAGTYYTGRVLRATVGYVLRDAPQFGLATDHAILSLADVEVEE